MNDEIKMTGRCDISLTPEFEFGFQTDNNSEGRRGHYHFKHTTEDMQEPEYIFLTRDEVIKLCDAIQRSLTLHMLKGGALCCGSEGCKHGLPKSTDS